MNIYEDVEGVDRTKTHDSAALLKLSRSDHCLDGKSHENFMYPALHSRMNGGQPINEINKTNKM